MTNDVVGRARRRRPAVVLAGAVLAGAVLAAGCGGAGDGDTIRGNEATSDESGAGGDAAGPAPGVATAEGSAEGAAVPAPADLTGDQVVQAQGERDIVRTGSLLLTVDDATGAAAEARRLTTDAGGFVADESARAEDHAVDLTVRVPAAGFEALRDDVAALGRVVEQDSQAQDVTAQVVDLDSRITSLRASVERLRGLLGQAGDVGQLAAVEGELASRESELESLLGQQRVLDDQVTLATLTVHLTEDEEPAVAEDAPGFTDGLRTGWVALLNTGQVALAGIGLAIPWTGPALLALLAVVAVRRAQRRRRPSAPPRPPAPAESAP
ncbi:MAG TPA: DUF4349 domain-containing protein [Acidimicrobiales bacterium]|nr:DUF4349 domain-containing protein [Acidimicrobiales bacterium]